MEGVLFSRALSGPTVSPLQFSGGITRKWLALDRKILYSIQSIYRFRPSSPVFPMTCVATVYVSVDLLGLECHLVASIRGQLGSQGQNCHFGSYPYRPFTPKPLPIFSLKLCTYLLAKYPFYHMEHQVCYLLSFSVNSAIPGP